MFDILLDVVDSFIESSEESETHEIIKAYIDCKREESNSIMDVLDRVNRL